MRNVATASLHQSSDLTALSPPHTQLAHACIAVPVEVSREEKKS